MRWTAVVNPAAGRGRARRLLPRLRSTLGLHDVAVHVSTDAADGARIAAEAFDRGEGVVACGGDGTVAGLAEVAASHGGPLAVVPTGAGNDFARGIGLDHRRPLEAIALLDQGHAIPIDLGRARAADGSTRAFTTVAHTGFDSEANRWANGVRWATGSTLYVLAVLRTVATYRPQPVTVRIDDDEWRGDAWLVAVGNTRGYAGGMQIAPAAVLDDGLLDVCIIGPGSTTRFVTRFPKVFRGTHVELDEVVTRRGREIEVVADGGSIPLDLWASGEPVGPLPATMTIATEPLHVVVARRAHDGDGPTGP